MCVCVCVCVCVCQFIILYQWDAYNVNNVSVTDFTYWCVYKHSTVLFYCHFHAYMKKREVYNAFFHYFIRSCRSLQPLISMASTYKLYSGTNYKKKEKKTKKCLEHQNRFFLAEVYAKRNMNAKKLCSEDIYFTLIL